MQPLTRANIRLAATVLLLRESSRGLQVFMQKRPGTGDFPDLHVFPGGKVDEQDVLPDLVSGCDESRANRLLGLSAGGLRYWVTAIRECFEECGVLLAHRDGNLVSLASSSEIARFDQYRHDLIDGRLELAALCRREALSLAGDRLLYFSHWLTPEAAPRRFDTRFFIARMPSAQETAAHQWETAGSDWVGADEALAAARSGAWRMIAPTTTTLKSIAGYSSLDALESAVRSETHLPELTGELRREGMMPLR